MPHYCGEHVDTESSAPDLNHRRRRREFPLRLRLRAAKHVELLARAFLGEQGASSEIMDALLAVGEVVELGGAEDDRSLHTQDFRSVFKTGFNRF
jgi:hypothetical protein